MTAPAARLFVALDLPDVTRAGLARWIADELAARRELRPVAAANLHLTLCFLGDRDEREIDAVADLVEACARPVDQLSLGAAVWLPRRRPRVLAVEASEPAARLADLERDVSQALVLGAGHRAETRPFRPHVTLARVRSGHRVDARARRSLGSPAVGDFSPAALTLYRSRPGPAGPSYEAVGRTALCS